MQLKLQNDVSFPEFQVNVQWEPGYDNVISSEILCTFYEKNAGALNVELCSARFGSGGSTDFGNLSHVVPGIHPMFALGVETDTHARGFTAIAGKYDTMHSRYLVVFFKPLTEVTP